MSRPSLCFASLVFAGAVTTAPAAAQADSKACKTGTIVFGNPTYDGATAKPNPLGQNVKQDPPLEWRGLAFAKGKVYTISGGAQEVWGGDPAGLVRRVAGLQTPTATRFTDGKCAEARFIQLRGITVRKDGAIIVVDTGANAVRAITDPDGPSCAVATLAGPQQPYDESAKLVPKPGDVDGAGKDAKLGGPEWVAGDDAGNLYFVDTLAGKLKMVAADAAHTVSTIASVKKDSSTTWTGLVLLDKKIYVSGNTAANGIVWEVDPATKKMKIVKDAPAKGFAPLDSVSPSITSIATDGTALLLSGQGYIWRMSKDGKAMDKISGQGSGLSYPEKYDPAVPHAFGDLNLRFRTDDAASSGTSTYMVWNDGSLYFRGRHISPYVLRIGCPK